AGSNDEVNNALVFDCRMFGVIVWVDNSFGPALNSGVINSKICDCGWNGFLAGSPFVINGYLINSEIYGCSDVGASSSATNTLITGNYIHDLNGTTGGGGNVEWGIAAEQGASGGTITQNTIVNCNVGVHIDENNCSISDNHITNSSIAGIMLSGTDHPNGCIYNTVTDN